jgi:Fe-S-cluster containining protein
MSDATDAKRRARIEAKETYLRRMLDRYADRFRAAAGRDAEAVAGEAHATIDELLDRERAKSASSNAIQCRKGCSHCCSNPVEIWPQEAVLLVEAAREAGVELDTARLERQGKRTIGDWRLQPKADRACVFLGVDGACRVYASRPNACRKLLVLGDPARCDTENYTPDDTERWFSWEAEMMELAALDTFGRGLMPGMLLAALAAN